MFSLAVPVLRCPWLAGCSSLAWWLSKPETRGGEVGGAEEEGEEVGGREGEWFPVFVAPATAVSGLAVGFLFLLRSTFFLLFLF
jgi:hypothetical protein